MFTESPTSLLILAAVITAIFGFASAWFWRQRNIARDNVAKIAAGHEVVLTRLNEAETQLRLVSATVLPISTAMQALLIRELTHFHTPEMDALMVKLGPPNVLTTEEQKRMEQLLEERVATIGPQISDSEREAAKILPIIIKRAQVEQSTLQGAKEMELKFVSIAAVIAIPNVEEIPLVKLTSKI